MPSFYAKYFKLCVLNKLLHAIFVPGLTYFLIAPLMLLYSQRADSEEDVARVQQSNIIRANLDSVCRGDLSIIKQAAEYVAKSLSQAAEEKMKDSSDLPRLLQLHELCYPVC